MAGPRELIAVPATRRDANLPVLAVLDELLAALATQRTAVLVAPPGTGKTTGVPPLLVAQPWVGDGRIVVVEPRRLAARAAATRMAELAGEPVGQVVGYSVRGERRVSTATRIEVVTEGLFLRRLQSDPTLEGVAAVLLDEFHERSVDIDLALALLTDVRSSLRPDLRLVVMSATIDPAPVADLLGSLDVGAGGGRAPVIEATAPMFDVATHYMAGSAHDPLEERVAAAVRVAVRDDPGDVLVFLPGRPEIHRVERVLARGRGGGPTDVDVLALHGSLSPAEQADVVGAHDGSRRRVILSTSLAETSITVPGVRVVIDAGRRRTIRVDPHTGLPALRTGPTSRAGSDQRRGRAGRVGPGVCYRLWGESEHRHRPAADTPEIIDGDLTALLLQLRSWGVGDPSELRWLDPPPPEAVDRARVLLGDLGAVDAEDRLTSAGREMAAIGFHPRLAAVALEGRRSGRTDLAAEVIAVLETSRSGDPDVVERVRSLRAGTATGDVTHALRMWQRSLGVRSGSVGSGSVDSGSADSGSAGGDALEESVARLLLAGSADRVALRRSNDRTDDRGRSRRVFHLRSGGEVALDPDDPLARSDWLVVADLDAGAPGQPGRVHLAAALPERVVADVIEPLIGTDDVVEWDPRRRDVAATRRRRLGAVTIDARPLQDPDPQLVRAALLEGVRTTVPRCSRVSTGPQIYDGASRGCAPRDPMMAGRTGRTRGSPMSSSTGWFRCWDEHDGPRTWTGWTSARRCSTRSTGSSGDRSTSWHRRTGPRRRDGGCRCATARSTASRPRCWRRSRCAT